jgi:hypothetical protein
MTTYRGIYLSALRYLANVIKKTMNDIIGKMLGCIHDMDGLKDPPHVFVKRVELKG